MASVLLRHVVLGCSLALLGCETTIKHDISGLACPGPDQLRTVSGECVCLDDTLEINPESGACEQPLFASIVFVIDNSGSMGRYQSSLGSSVAGLAAILDAAQINYRIAFTTTDNGNPQCEAGQTTPEHGGFVFESCRQRIGDFVLDELGVDESSTCEGVCTQTHLAQVSTPIEDSSEIALRPWLEVAAGEPNVGIAVADALRCAAPQGISGCGFESPLAAGLRALERARDPADANYGFLSHSALTAIVFVTDEADCSYNPNTASIFTAEGDKTFWSDPTASAPSSAVCWNAGVSCVGPAGDYVCTSTNKDPQGAEVSSGADASLIPVSGFISAMQGPTLAFGIYGQLQTGDYVYREGSDDAFRSSFGIGPGCVHGGQGAVPPVRLREFVEAFMPDPAVGADQANAFSICEDDLSPALDEVALAIVRSM